MEFNKFKQMATDYEDFMNHIKEVSEEYCLLKDIKHNPMDGYWHGDNWCEYDNLKFEFNEDSITIKDAHEVGRCGETEWEPYQLSIPMDFFNAGNKYKIELEFKRTQEKIERLESKLKTDKSQLANLRGQEREIREDMWKMKRMAENYSQVFNEIPFNQKISDVNSAINILIMSTQVQEQEIKKLKS
jgi:hypothetical protein